MYRTSIASSKDHEEVIAFLERQGLLENAWLIWDIFTVFQYNPDGIYSVLICRLHDDIVGVACILDYRKMPPSPSGSKPDHDYDSRIDAVNRDAVKALLEAFPTDALGNFSIFRPMIQEYFRELPDAKRMEGDLYFSVSAKHFRAVTGESVIELTANDVGLFEGCEKKRSWEYSKSPVFAMMRDDRVATSVRVGAVIPKTARTKRRVIAITGLYTETKYRRMGLGRQLVSHVTGKILNDGNVPVYWTEPENIASQSLAKSLGYWQIGQIITYRWRKKA